MTGQAEGMTQHQRQKLLCSTTGRRQIAMQHRQKAMISRRQTGRRHQSAQAEGVNHRQPCDSILQPAQRAVIPCACPNNLEVAKGQVLARCISLHLHHAAVLVSLAQRSGPLWRHSCGTCHHRCLAAATAGWHFLYVVYDNLQRLTTSLVSILLLAETFEEWLTLDSNQNVHNLSFRNVQCGVVSSSAVLGQARVTYVAGTSADM